MGDTDVEAVAGFKESDSKGGAGAGAAWGAGVRLSKPERKQFEMRWSCPDELVGKDHRVRMVAAVVAKLDLSGLYAKIKAVEGGVGRDATDPALLVSLWLYAAVRGIGSARELARRCLESDPFRWLCGGVGVNHRLLSEFRVKHAEVLDDLFTQVLASLVDQGLVKVKRITQDGVRVRAAAGSGSFKREQRLKELLDKARAHVAELRRHSTTQSTRRHWGPGRRRLGRRRLGTRPVAWRRRWSSCRNSRKSGKKRPNARAARRGRRSATKSFASAAPTPRRG